MEYDYIPEIPDDETLNEYFPTLKDELHIVTSNKYFHIEKKKKASKKQTPRQSQKGKMSKMEWFESLDTSERIEAVSTIATENPMLVKTIKNDIKKIEDKYKRLDATELSGYPRDDYITGDISGTDSHGYYRNWNAEVPVEFPGCIHSIISNFTFLDYKSAEDTISVHEEFVLEPVEFFHTLKAAWDELRDNCEAEYTARDKYLDTVWRLGLGENYKVEERTLCGKILCLIELALNATYARSMNDKRSYNSKCYVNSSQALWRQNEELIIENLDLNKELLDFITNADNDPEEASKYLSLEETQSAYGATELMSAQESKSHKTLISSENNEVLSHKNLNGKSSTCTREEVEDRLSSHCRSKVIKDIKEFRTELITRIRPNGDAISGYIIVKPQNKLYGILDETRLYQNGKYADDRVRLFARYFYDRLANKSREVMAEKLILEIDNIPNEKDTQSKVDKKSNKNKRKRRNKNKNKEEPAKAKQALDETEGI